VAQPNIRLATWRLLAAIALIGPRAVSAWQEADFPPRPVTTYFFSLDRKDPSTLIGEPRRYTFAKGDTLYDVARHLGLGINGITEAYPALDVWLPTVGATLEFPTSWILPESDYQGIVVNIPEMRAYYFPKRGTRWQTVVTYAVGLGRDDWQTPTGKFRVTEKTVDPDWIVPDSIRAEHIRDRGDGRKTISGGDPGNPLGHYRMRLNLPLYGIHGTNVPWGVGMQVSHGCVRLYPEDIKPLFTMVPVGTPGEFVYQPVKIGARSGDIYVEVHSDVYQRGFDYMAAAKQALEGRAWSALVDWDLLTAALQQKRGVPTVVSEGQPLHRAGDGRPMALDVTFRRPLR
jgi:L,D-transpeptidase ErfK/SrfK